MLFFTVSLPPTILALEVGRAPHDEGNGLGPGPGVGGSGPGGLGEAGGGAANDRKKPYIIKKSINILTYSFQKDISWKWGWEFGLTNICTNEQDISLWTL